MTRFHVSIERRNWNKQIQTAILKVNTSEHIQKKVYTFFSFCMDFTIKFGFREEEEEEKTNKFWALTLK